VTVGRLNATKKTTWPHTPHKIEKSYIENSLVEPEVLRIYANPLPHFGAALLSGV
jgi:hypothetical protein